MRQSIISNVKVKFTGKHRFKYQFIDTVLLKINALTKVIYVHQSAKVGVED